MVQIALAGAAIYFCRAGSIWLIIMPLVSHSVLLLPLSLSATFAVVVTLLSTMPSATLASRPTKTGGGMSI